MATSDKWKQVLFNVACVVLGAGCSAFYFYKGTAQRGDEMASYGIGLIAASPVLVGIFSGLMYPSRAVAKAALFALLFLVGMAPLMNEGIICLIVIAPAFYIIALPVAAVVAKLRLKSLAKSGAEWTLLLLFAIPPSLAQLDKYLTPATTQAVSIADSVIVDVDFQTVWNTIEHTRFTFPNDKFPWYAKLLMPVPQAIVGEGAGIGDRRHITFHNGTVDAKIVESRPPYFFKFLLTAKATGPEFFNHWVRFADSSFHFEIVDAERTKITHTTRYYPRVYPRFYFAPFERALASVSQAYMLRTFTTQKFAPIPLLDVADHDH